MLSNIVLVLYNTYENLCVGGGGINYLYGKYLKVFRYVKMSSVKQYKTHTGNSGNNLIWI